MDINVIMNMIFAFITAIWMSCIDLLISSNKQGYQDGEHLTDYGKTIINFKIFILLYKY